MPLTIAPIHFSAIPGRIFDGTAFAPVESGFHPLDQYASVLHVPPLHFGSGVLSIFGLPYATLGGTKKADSRQSYEIGLELLRRIHAEPELRKILLIALDTGITPIEKRILTWRFPWLECEDGRGLTLRETGEKYNLRPERIRYLEVQALKKMVRNIDEGKVEGVDLIPGIERLPILLESWRRDRESVVQEKRVVLQGALAEAVAALEIEKVNETAFRVAKNATFSGDPKKRARKLAIRWRNAFAEGLRALRGVEGAAVLAQMIANQCFTALQPRKKARNEANRYKEVHGKPARNKEARSEFMKAAVKAIIGRLDGIDRREELAKRIAERAWIRRTKKSLALSMADGWKRAYFEAIKHLKGRDQADEIAREIADEVFSWHYSDRVARELVEAITFG